MKNTIPNRKVICDVLMEHAKEDKDIKATATIKVNAAIPSYGISVGKIVSYMLFCSV